MSNVNVKPGVQLMSRLLVLHKAVSELAKGFGLTDQSALDVIRKGIIDQQLVKSIYICYRDENDKLRGTVILDIDWELHEVAAKTGPDTFIKVDPSKNFLDQLSEVYRKIVEHMEYIRIKLGIVEFQRVFILRDEIVNNSEKFNKAVEFLDLTILSDNEWDEIKNKKYPTQMGYRNFSLKELNITAFHDKL